MIFKKLFDATRDAYLMRWLIHAQTYCSDRECDFHPAPDLSVVVIYFTKVWKLTATILCVKGLLTHAYIL